ncbi:Biotin carboxyl carrier of acetyl-carboxylase isoform B [Micractinium conductrix]|uniref:Biotin carboxyl carrier of acetyl-carboxylase isoform B n=1 Tax=Micractinium conductrix TaxID=554055 RepID=A0A2P6VQ38_9CHLO|nr:Biotin carboxyl carrier of acetyl-carboxylase isoform B [Micractinium conductrix]|eukprot:PSC76187.1 Biotin carboxyl carrier of acetyl-carboxylase isoform B [Micractinium conductrix]
MATAQLSLARPSSRVIASRQIVAPRRLSAALPRRAPLCRSTKLAEVEAASKHEKKSKREEEEEEWDGGEDDGLNPQQVESLLSVLCEETDIAEVELKMGSFKMRVRRSLKGGAAAAAAAPAPVAAAPPPAPAAPAPAASFAPSVSSLEATADEDESLLDITANKVGILRRGRYMKGKQVGKGEMVKVGDQVKKGQTVAFIEQLGTHWPLEAPQAGEVVEFLVEEGEPVEYKQPVLVIAPYFEGNK